MFKFLQWNMNGFYNNYTDLELLIKEQSSTVITLQETHLSFNTAAAVPKQYSAYFSNLTKNLTSKQGVATLIKKDIPHKFFPTYCNISTIAVEIFIGFKLTILTVYIPPHQNFNIKELRDIIRPIQATVIILGDFNAWSPLWGSECTNQRGKIPEDLILAENLSILNDVSPTLFYTQFIHKCRPGPLLFCYRPQTKQANYTI